MFYRLFFLVLGEQPLGEDAELSGTALSSSAGSELRRTLTPCAQTSVSRSPYRCYNVQRETAGPHHSGSWFLWGAWCRRRLSPAPCRHRKRWTRLCRRAAGWPAPDEHESLCITSPACFELCEPLGLPSPECSSHEHRWAWSWTRPCPLWL